ncbi:hypothetical protein LJR078_001037 [Arthrobacter sp. LjRoot78]
MENTRTIESADGSLECIVVHAKKFEYTSAATDAAIPEGTKLSAIRTDS